MVAIGIQLTGQQRKGNLEKVPYCLDINKNFMYSTCNNTSTETKKVNILIA